MKLEKLETRQQQELNDYLKEYEKGRSALENDQKELVSLCMIAGPKAHELLKNLLNEQRQAWEAMQKDELDMLKHMHFLERENFFEKQSMRGELINRLSADKVKSSDRGR
jgi:hypothetical protein